MANLNGVNTNATPSEDFELIPIGEYAAVIESDEVKTSKSGNGDYLSVKVKLIGEGKYKNRVVYTILNLWNTNPKAKEIAERELAAIKDAVGVTNLQDTAQLHNKPLTVKLGQEHSDKYGDKSTVKGWKALGKPLSGGGNKPQNTPPTSSPTSSASGRSDVGYIDDMPDEMRNF